MSSKWYLYENPCRNDVSLKMNPGWEVRNMCDCAVLRHEEFPPYDTCYPSLTFVELSFPSPHVPSWYVPEYTCSFRVDSATWLPGKIM